jgi:hypothetical protein
MTMSDTIEAVGFEEFSKAELEKAETLLKIRDTRLRFALENHLNTAGRKMNFTDYPHIREIYNSLSPEICIMGSVQSLKSEWVIIDHFACAYVGLQVFFVIPKYEMRNTYVQNRVNRVVERVPEYKKITDQSFFDNIALKNFGDGVIRYVGSNVLADFKEFPADVIFVEELDECAADNLDYAHDRLRASRFQFKRYVGNPTLEKIGIHARYLRSSQGVWHVPCKDCGEYAPLDWFETVVEPLLDSDGNVVDYRLRDSDWEQGNKRDIHCICPKCKGVLDRFSKKGKWVHKHPERSAGYHISMLVSPVNFVCDMYQRFMAGMSDPGLLQAFYNSDLGLPFQAVGSRLTEDTILRATQCEEPYDLIVQGPIAFIEGDQDAGPCTMGIDVGSSFDVRISRILSKGRRKAVFIGKVSNRDELVNLTERYNVEVAVIDAMPEPTLSQDFQEEAPCNVWLCRYSSEGDARRINRNYKILEVRVDRTTALDRSFNRLKTGHNILPRNYAAFCSGEWLSEMCAPVRQVISDAKGNQKFAWSKCKDHSRHADTYDDIAAQLVFVATLGDISIG